MNNIFKTSIFALALILVGTGCATAETTNQQIEDLFSLELRTVERPDDPYIERHQEIDIARMVDGEQHIVASLGMQLGGCHDYTVFVDEFLFDDSYQEIICSGEGAVNVYALAEKEEGVHARSWSMHNIIGEMTDKENFTLESDWFIPVKTNEVNISNLGFDLLEGMSVAYIDGDTAILNVPHSEHELTVPFHVSEVELSLSDRALIETTAEGVEIYEEFCAPSYGCAYLLKEGIIYQAVFEMASSDEVPPEELDGIWFPDMEIEMDEWFSIFSTAR